MWTRKFWLDALERATRTGAQIIAIGWPASAAILDATNWKFLGVTAAGAAGLSLVMSLAGLKTGDPTSASLVPAKATEPEPAP